MTAHTCGSPCKYWNGSLAWGHGPADKIALCHSLGHLTKHDSTCDDWEPPVAYVPNLNVPTPDE